MLSKFTQPTWTLSLSDSSRNAKDRQEMRSYEFNQTVYLQNYTRLNKKKIIDKINSLKVVYRHHFKEYQKNFKVAFCGVGR